MIIDSLFGLLFKYLNICLHDYLFTCLLTYVRACVHPCGHARMHIDVASII